MFPLRDDNPTHRVSITTIALIAANLAVWVLVQGMGESATLTRSICQFGLIPGDLLDQLPEGRTVRLGPEAVCTLGQGPSWLTLFTSMFLHGSWFHIIGNLWFLWVFGNNVEDAMSRLRYPVFYVLCGLAAAAAQIAANPSSAVPMVGASGAIGGVMGAYAVLFPRAHVHTLIIFGIFARVVAVPAFVMLGYWFLIQILAGLPTLGSEEGGVAFWAHIGGFLAGVVLVLPFRTRRSRRTHRG